MLCTKLPQTHCVCHFKTQQVFRYFFFFSYQNFKFQKNHERFSGSPPIRDLQSSPSSPFTTPEKPQRRVQVGKCRQHQAHTSKEQICFSCVWCFFIETRPIRSERRYRCSRLPLPERTVGDESSSSSVSTQRSHPCVTIIRNFLLFRGLSHWILSGILLSKSFSDSIEVFKLGFNKARLASLIG